MKESKWRPKTKAKNKLRLNMKRILNPKLKKEKITVIKDSSTEEDMESEKGLSPQQVYIEKEHSVSLEPVQGRHKASEKETTFSIEQGMSSKVPFVQEIMKDGKEDDLIFKKFDISWLSNQGSILQGEGHTESKIENLKKTTEQHKSHICFLMRLMIDW